MADALASLRISFRSAELEERYCAQRTASLFFFVDRNWFGCVRTVVPIVFAARHALRGSGDLAVMLVLGLVSAVFAFLVVLARRGDGWAIRMRGRVGIFLRGVLFPFVFCLCMFAGILPIPQRPDWAGLLLWCYFCSGLAMVISSPFVVPLLLKHHLPVNVLVAYLIVAHWVPRFCSLVEGHGAMREPVVAAWGAMSAGVGQVVDAVYSGLPNARAPDEPDLGAACQHMFTSLHLIFGLVFVVYVMWVSEYQSRAFFLGSASGREERRGEGRWPPLARTSIALHVLLLAVLGALCWEGLLGVFF